jgi:hypothetical protein
MIGNIDNLSQNSMFNLRWSKQDSTLRTLWSRFHINYIPHLINHKKNFTCIISYSNIFPSLLHVSSGRKVEDPDMLERIRLTIINNLLKYHPVCFGFLCFDSY